MGKPRRHPMMHANRRLVLSLAVLGLMTGAAGRARADMSLTAAGTAQGFAVSTFATGFGFPLGIAVTNAGNVLVADGTIKNFASDTDNQTAASATNTGTGAFGLTSGNGLAYATGSVGGVTALNNNGSVNHVVTNNTGGFGITFDPVSGNLFVSTDGVTIVNPTTGATHVLVSAGFFTDGIAVSNDGQTVYVTNESNAIFGYNTTTGAQVFSANLGNVGPDGVAVGTGSLAGKLFSNNNNGTIVEIDLATNTQTVIATGGSRGDFVTVDPNGSLLLTQSDRVLRLAPPRRRLRRADRRTRAFDDPPGDDGQPHRPLPCLAAS
jgi:sugar lactone lactonase YvrE